MTSRKIPEFDLIIPSDLSEAFNHLDNNGKSTSIMAGGTDLLTDFKSNATSKFILSLGKITNLDMIEYDDSGELRIGALTKLADIVNSDKIKKEYPALRSSASVNGTVQTRNMATLVGNILRGSPTGDCCCAVLAYGGKVVLKSSEGTREVDIDEFWTGYRANAKKDNEIATEIKLPVLQNNIRSSFQYITRTNMDLAKINASVCLTINASICENARISIGGVAETPIRVKEIENMIIGNKLTEELINQVAEMVPSKITPIDDVRSTAEYRKHVSGTLVKRAIISALT